MNTLLGDTPKTFSLLSIGQRGVGKTVFLAGSYAELHGDSQSDNFQQLWFDCQDSDVQASIEKVLSYIAQTNLYPPPTIKITNFNFSLKRRSLWGTKTLCHFRWWDIPGESCNVRNSDFKKIVYAAQGCCVFIDAHALVHNSAYLQTLEDIIEQVMAIASLVHQSELKYAFALVLTKCDLLQLSQLKRHQIEKSLQPLVIRLDKVRANYQTFYSFIPIINTEGTTTLRATGAAAPLMWLTCELIKVYKPSLLNNLSTLVSLLTSRSQLQQDQVDGALEHWLKSTDKTSRFTKLLGRYLSPSRIQKVLRLTLICFGLFGGVGVLVSIYNRHIQYESSLDISRHRAISSMEKLVQEKPESIELRLQLAQLYELTVQVQKAETAYDQVLAQQRNNLKALVGKAVLRKVQGDIKTAEALFVQAEKAAPTNLKVQVRATAQKTLASPAKLMPDAK